MSHVDYPHWPGTLYDCQACEDLMDQMDQMEVIMALEEDTDPGETIVLDEELEDESV